MAVAGSQGPNVESGPKQDEEWLYAYLNDQTRGINLSDRPDRIRDEECLEAVNVRFDAGEVLSDFGYKTFGQVVRGNPRVSYQFFLKNGTSVLVLITNDTFYKWSTSELEWQYVDDGVSTTVNANEAGGQTVITVADISGFSDTDFVGIILDDGTQHQTTINGAPAATEITITDALPSAASIGNAFVKAVDLVGDDDLGVSVATWAAVDRMYFANGKDDPLQFDGTSVSGLTGLGGSTFKCAVVVVFKDHLLLMNTIEDGTVFPQRVRWSLPGDPTSWDWTVNVVDLYDSEDFILSAGLLGPYNIIYRERSIERQSHIGATDKTWLFERMIDAEGVLSVDSLINLGDIHIIFGNANIYEYVGDLTIKPLGDKIFDKIFSKNGILNPQRAARVFAVYVEELDELWAFLAAGADDYPKHLVKMKVSTGAFSLREFPIAFTGFGFFQTTGDRTWNDLTGTWETQTWTWLSKQLQAQAPTMHLCGQDKQIYEYDYVEDKDDGADIGYTFITKEFISPNKELRFDRYEFMLKGTSVLVEASYDEGKSWTTLGTVSPGGAFSRQRLFKQRVSRSIRFRFTGTDGFGLRWLGFRYKEESLW